MKFGFRLIGFIVGFGIIAFMLWKAGIDNVMDAVSRANPALIFLGLLFFSLNIITKIYKWVYLCAKNRIKIDFSESVIACLPSLFLANITPARLGEAYKAFVMKRKHNLPLTKGFTMLFYEKLTETIALVAFASLAIFFLPISTAYKAAILGSVVFMIIVIVLFVNMPAMFSRLERVIVKVPHLKNLATKKFIKGLDKSIKGNLNLGILLSLFLLAVIGLLLEGIKSWLILFSFGYNINLISLTIVLCIATVLGMVSNIPLGLGVIEGSMFSLYLVLGIPAGVAAPAILIDRIIALWLVILVGAILMRTSLVKEKAIF